MIRVEVPGSKSITNRGLLCAAMASGSSTLTGALVADDTAAMTDCLRALGATIEWDGTTVRVSGTGGRLPDTAELDARQSGTTSRFVLPVLASGAGRYSVDGHEQLRRRPMGPILDALRSLGATVEHGGEADRLPVVVVGPVPGGAVTVRADLSSQFVSGLLLAGPLLSRGIELTLEGDVVAAPFIAMTAAVMRRFGASVDGLRVEPGGYWCADLAVEPDASAASYFLAAAALTGRPVEVAGLSRSSLQGDARFGDVLREMGAPGPLHGVDVDLSDMPDMAQTFGVVAACASGPSRVRGVAVIRGHETDRITAMVTELRRVGVGAEETDDGFTIEPAALRAAMVRTYDDHRMAMSFGVLSLVEPGITVDDPSVVAKTFPGFWDALARLRS